VFWDVESGKLTGTVDRNFPTVEPVFPSVALTRDGRLVALLEDEKTVKIWSAPAVLAVLCALDVVAILFLAAAACLRAMFRWFQQKRASSGGRCAGAGPCHGPAEVSAPLAGGEERGVPCRGQGSPRGAVCRGQRVNGAMTTCSRSAGPNTHLARPPDAAA